MTWIHALQVGSHCCRVTVALKIICSSTVLFFFYILRNVKPLELLLIFFSSWLGPNNQVSLQSEPNNTDKTQNADTNLASVELRFNQMLTHFICQSALWKWHLFCGLIGQTRERGGTRAWSRREEHRTNDFQWINTKKDEHSPWGFQLSLFANNVMF